MISIIAAFQFLTIFPALIKRMFTPQEMARAVGWFPLMGVVLEALLFGMNHVARLVFPETISAALTLIAWVLLTRAFHLDGFMDTCDGLFGGFTPERRLEIMKDSRVGAFGVAGGALA
ncbi:MAG: adenosylcobinamide-GDP ribazoletransferase, partial [Anaerolineales bacterium]|nr:adenosylcobinamide-GDP ribazoletransferase [Anaerolineales bacterium]